MKSPLSTVAARSRLAGASLAVLAGVALAAPVFAAAEPGQRQPLNFAAIGMFLAFVGLTLVILAVLAAVAIATSVIRV